MGEEQDAERERLLTENRQLRELLDHRDLLLAALSETDEVRRKADVVPHRQYLADRPLDLGVDVAQPRGPRATKSSGLRERSANIPLRLALGTLMGTMAGIYSKAEWGVPLGIAVGVFGMLLGSSWVEVHEALLTGLERWRTARRYLRGELILGLVLLLSGAFSDSLRPTWRVVMTVAGFMLIDFWVRRRGWKDEA
jgi:hypothetical protein